MSQQYIFTIEALTRIYEQKEVLSNIWLSFYPGAKIGVIGDNGAGKSTLLRIMAGEDKDFMGTARPAKNLRIGYFPQEPRLEKWTTVDECIQDAVSESRAILDRYNEINMKLAEDLSPEQMEKLLDEQSRVQDKIDAANLWELDRTLEVAADAMRLPPAEAKIAHLSGGEKRRVGLCRILLQSPDLLLLDEPTNHLDAESVSWLERFLHDFTGTVVAITHDRYFLDNVAGWILEMDRGRGYPYEGNYSGWLEQKQARLAIDEKRESKRQKELKRELDWVRTSPKARSTKNKARLERYNELASQQYDARDEAADIQIAPGPPLGELVVRAENVSKAFGETLLFEGLNFDLPRGGIVGVIGPNGAGKTTLFKMIMGLEKADAGTLRIGDGVFLSYVDQSRDALDPNKTVYEEVSGGRDFIEIGKSRIHSRAYVGRFNFKGQDQQKFVRELSGGERNRIHLAKLLRTGGNVLLLDEPTNDLDVDTLRALEEAIQNFGGCVMVSSHDRWFLDRTATHILAFEGDSRVVWFEGNYQMYEIQRHERLGDEADQPHRIKYRPLAHIGKTHGEIRMITASAGQRFRDALKQPPLMIPGVFNALTARLAERAGFRAAYQSGAALSASLAALPDVGLINQTEFAQQGHYLVSAVSIPVISDADTGFGEALAVERTVTLFESAGLAGLHLEDQNLPKRCGHLSGKSLVSCAEMVSKLKAAVAARRDPSFVIIARTDGRASEGLEAAIDRAQAYVEAGADMIFPEALESPDEFGRFAGAIKVPLLANMTEFGKSPLLTATELGKLGYAAVLFPVTMLRVAAKAVEDALAQLARDGSQEGFVDRMQTRAELYDLLNYTGFESRDQAYFGR